MIKRKSIRRYEIVPEKRPYHQEEELGLGLSLLMGCVYPQNAIIIITTEEGSVIEIDPKVKEPCEAQYGKGSRPDSIGAKYGRFMTHKVTLKVNE